MKLSKNLLQAVAIGVTLGSISSCSLFSDTVEVGLKDDLTTEEAEESSDDAPDVCWSDCPACGLG